MGISLKAMDDLQEQFYQLNLSYPNLKLRKINGGAYLLSGKLEFNAIYAQHEINDVFDIIITIPNNYPIDLPTVADGENRIPDNFHKHKDGTFCLGVPLEIRKKFLETPSLLGYVNNLVIPYLFSFCYKKKHGEMPYGEIDHGGKGILEYYKKIFGLDSEVKVLKLLKLLIENNCGAHKNCPCGSEKKLKDCHGNILKTIINIQSKKALFYDYYHCLACCEFNKLNLPKILFSKKIKKLFRKYSNTLGIKESMSERVTTASDSEHR
jgi:hypothetical protein